MTFFSGSTNDTSECVNITLPDDAALEEDKTFTVTLTTSDSDVMLGNAVTVITIANDDGALGEWV